MDRFRLFPVILLIYACYILCMFFISWVELGVILTILIVVLSIFQFRFLAVSRYGETNHDLILNLLNPSINNLYSYMKETEELTFTDIYMYTPRYGISSDKDRLRELRFWHSIIKHEIEEFNESCDPINDKIKYIIDIAMKNHILGKSTRGADYEYSLENSYEKNTDKLNTKLKELGIDKGIDNINKRLKKLRTKWRNRYRYKDMNF